MTKDTNRVMEVTRRQAITAAQQFCSGIARWAAQWFDINAHRRLLKLPNSTDAFLDPADDNRDERGIYNDAISEAWFVDAVSECFSIGEERAVKGRDEWIHGLCVWYEFNESRFEPEYFVFGQQGDSAIGATIDGMAIRDILNFVIYRAHAIWRIEEDDSLSVAELALIAGVSEKTVRNATSAKGPNRLPSVPGSDVGRSEHPSHRYIKAIDAIAWLGARGISFGDGKPLPKTIHNVDQLADVVNQYSEYRGIDHDQLMEAVNSVADKPRFKEWLTGDVRIAVTDLEFLTIEALAALANVLQIENRREFIRDSALTLARARTLHQLKEIHA